MRLRCTLHVIHRMVWQARGREAEAAEQRLAGVGAGGKGRGGALRTYGGRLCPVLLAARPSSFLGTRHPSSPPLPELGPP